MSLPTRTCLAALVIPTFLVGLGGCDESLLDCATFDGHLANFPGLSLAGARERCGRTLDSYAYLADRETLMVALTPWTKEQDLKRALSAVSMELSLPTDLEIGQVIELPPGRIAEKDAQGISRVTAVATGGRIVVEDITWDDGVPETVTLNWDLTFGNVQGDGPWVTVFGADTLEVSRAFVKGL